MTDTPSTLRTDAALRDLHATLSRIRNIDPTPPLLEPDSETGQAYTHGWHAHRAAVETELVNTQTAETAEAAIARVRALVDEHPVAVGTHLLEEALDQPKEAQ